MPRKLLMPKLGLTMMEGALIEWMVEPGDAFEAGQSLFVVESEKAAIEVPAEAAGVLLDISVQPGATMPVGSVLGHWDSADEANRATAPAPRPEVPAKPSAAPERKPEPAMTVSTLAQPPAAQVSRVPVTPLARRLAVQHGIDLTTVQGSGPRGRIRARDIELARQTVAAKAQSAPPSPSKISLRSPTAIEQTIARRLTAAKQEIPHFYLSVEAELSKVQGLRRELNAAQEEMRFTLNHFILAAVGRALVEVPQVNRVWTEEGIASFESSDVGMAVNTSRGLMVPVLRGVGRLPLAALARKAGVAIETAQAGRLTAEEMTGGAITVSNAGMHDVTYMASIINPGQAMILGVGSMRELFRPDAEGRPMLRREMGMVLSADHRVLDGVTALGFLKRVVYHLERPLGLLIA